MKRILTIAAVACMALMTLWPWLYGANEHSYNDGISWFWTAWALISVRFLIVAFGRWRTMQTWSRYRTMNLAFALILLGVDTARIRTDTFDHVFNGDSSTLGVYLVRLYVGWSFVWFMGYFRGSEAVPAG
jgi:hypothetical protein